ncbi:branched-chain amino acid ABC transporter permease [Azoarcus sp. TTM-91]|uniref:branched-chain amino acid ABC transporter permease n=1 Tax=Azoarcus sp. TTM-91 TaxID=2691581 RepID=UPI00145D068C|nr:branched-chain amino acid ABC transporter permease [Azoarcus sp. TTM-91]NMG33745.1 branched-chain amino acid ABC transporter permease [Azoarcus sp. TTM-91]
MLTFIQVLVSGVAMGCVYGLVALSFVLIYKAADTVSFMQGELLMVGAFAVVALQAAGWPLAVALIGGVAGAALLGAVLERTVLRHTLGQPAMGQSHLGAVLLTFGLGLMLRGGVTAVPAASHGMFALPLPWADAVVRLGPLSLPGGQLLVMAVTALAAAALSLFFRYSRSGLALRACAEDARSAALMGVPVARMHTLAWALGAALAALAGVLLAPITFVHLNMGFIALKAFPAAVLGGLTSLPGALAGGVFLGVVEALAGLVLPEGTKDVVPYLLLLAALLLFPAGFGARRAA